MLWNQDNSLSIPEYQIISCFQSSYINLIKFYFNLKCTKNKQTRSITYKMKFQWSFFFSLLMTANTHYNNTINTRPSNGYTHWENKFINPTLVGCLLSLEKVKPSSWWIYWRTQWCIRTWLWTCDPDPNFHECLFYVCQNSACRQLNTPHCCVCM